VNKPLITIGLTTFNAIQTVENAIASALYQNWRPIEVIVVDDCSTDGTYEFLYEISANHVEIKLFRNHVNLGVAATRNRILKEARGEFVAFFDDDDISVPERISCQYSRITEYEMQYNVKGLVVCHTARSVVYPCGKVRVERTMGQNFANKAPNGYAVVRRILMGFPINDGYGACPTCTQMSRLYTYNLVGGFDVSLKRSEDTDLNLRLALKGGHFVGLAKPLVNQFMTRTPDKSLEEEIFYMKRILRKFKLIMDRESQYEFCSKWLDLKYAFLQHRYIVFVLGLVNLIVRYPLFFMKRFCWAMPSVLYNYNFSKFYMRKTMNSN